MPHLPAHPLRVLAWLIATACSAHAGETADGSTAADPSKLTAGATLMTDYIYRGLSYSAHHPAVAPISMPNTAGSTAIRISTA